MAAECRAHPQRPAAWARTTRPALLTADCAAQRHDLKSVIVRHKIRRSLLSLCGPMWLLETHRHSMRAPESSEPCRMELGTFCAGSASYRLCHAPSRSTFAAVCC